MHSKEQIFLEAKKVDSLKALQDGRDQQHAGKGSIYGDFLRMARHSHCFLQKHYELRLLPPLPCAYRAIKLAFDHIINRINIK